MLSLIEGPTARQRRQGANAVCKRATACAPGHRNRRIRKLDRHTPCSCSCPWPQLARAGVLSGKEDLAVAGLKTLASSDLGCLKQEAEPPARGGGGHGRPSARAAAGRSAPVKLPCRSQHAGALRLAPLRRPQLCIRVPALHALPWGGSATAVAVAPLQCAGWRGPCAAGAARPVRSPGVHHLPPPCPSRH